MKKYFGGVERNLQELLLRFLRSDARDYITSPKNDHGASYRHYGASALRNRPKTDICEIFGVVRFSTFSTLSTLNGHHRRGYRTDRDFMCYPLIISASVSIAVQAIPSVNIGSQRQGTHRSRVSEPTIPDRDYPYRHPTELIFCDQLTQVGVLSEYSEYS